MNKILLQIGVSLLLTLAIGYGVKYALKKWIINSKPYTEVSEELKTTKSDLINARFRGDSLNVASLNFENKARALENKNNQLQAKLDSFTKYNKVCYQKVLETKGFLKKKTWVFAEIPCSKIK